MNKKWAMNLHNLVSKESSIVVEFKFKSKSNFQNFSQSGQTWGKHIHVRNRKYDTLISKTKTLFKYSPNKLHMCFPSFS
jgi:hypothetical protein